MTRSVPFDIDYKGLSKVDTSFMWLLTISAIVSIAIFIIDSMQAFPEKACIIAILNIISCVIAVSYFIADTIFSYLFQSAEANRRNDFFDNSLNTQIADKNSFGYFSNDTMAPGILKLGVNSFENSFFTKNVASEMLHGKVKICIVMVLIYIVVSLSGDRSLVVLFLQLALPFTLIQKTIRLFVLRNRVEDVFTKFQTIFSSAKEDNKAGLILHNATSYETALAWGGIQTDDDIFHKLNPQLSIEWETIKDRYGLK
jgi:hypothetical protein